MRRLVGALVLAGTISMSTIPGASAQIPFGPPPGPVIESFGFSNGVPFNSSSFSGPGGIQCQYGGYLNGLGNNNNNNLISVNSINQANVSPFFTASAYGPVFGPGPCTLGALATGSLGGITPLNAFGGGLGFGGIGGGVLGGGNTLASLGSATLQQLVGNGLATSSTTNGVTTFTLNGFSAVTLTNGQTLASTTLSQLVAANPGSFNQNTFSGFGSSNGFGFGGGLGGLNTGFGSSFSPFGSSFSPFGSSFFGR